MTCHWTRCDGIIVADCVMWFPTKSVQVFLFALARSDWRMRSGERAQFPGKKLWMCASWKSDVTARAIPFLAIFIFFFSLCTPVSSEYTVSDHPLLTIRLKWNMNNNSWKAYNGEAFVCQCESQPSVRIWKVLFITNLIEAKRNGTEKLFKKVPSSKHQ